MKECYFYQHSSKGVFHGFLIMQMVPNHVKRLKYFCRSEVYLGSCQTSMMERFYKKVHD